MKLRSQAPLLPGAHRRHLSDGAILWEK